jgi:hypothetical protein
VTVSVPSRTRSTGTVSLLHYGLLGVQGDLVLFFGDVRTGQRVAAVGVGDGLALEADFLVADRHGLGDLLGDHVLAQPDPARLHLLSADVQPLLGPRHRIIADGPGRALPRNDITIAVPGLLRDPAVGIPGLGVPGPGLPALGVPALAAAEVTAVVLVESVLLVLADMGVVAAWPGRWADSGSPRRGPGMTTPEAAQDFVGCTAVDSEGSKVGKIGQLYLDDQSGQPLWVTVSTGLFGTRQSFAPVYGSQLEGDQVRLAVSKDQIKDAPNIGSAPANAG